MENETAIEAVETSYNQEIKDVVVKSVVAGVATVVATFATTVVINFTVAKIAERKAKKQADKSEN